MANEITIDELMELYLDTLRKCGIYLLNSADIVIEYNIFEEFDTGITSFLHIDSLVKLNEAGFISDEVMDKSSALRSMVMDIQQTDKWNVESVKQSPEWQAILELSDEIRGMLE